MKGWRHRRGRVRRGRLWSEHDVGSRMAGGLVVVTFGPQDGGFSKHERLDVILSLPEQLRIPY
jgi:hypothetical protein